MEIKNGLKEWFDSIESDTGKRLHFMAFRDFCCDLLEEECGKIPEGEEIDPRFVRGFSYVNNWNRPVFFHLFHLQGQRLPGSRQSVDFSFV